MGREMSLARSFVRVIGNKIDKTRLRRDDANQTVENLTYSLTCLRRPGVGGLTHGR